MEAVALVGELLFEVDEGIRLVGLKGEGDLGGSGTGVLLGVEGMKFGVLGGVSDKVVDFAIIIHAYE